MQPNDSRIVRGAAIPTAVAGVVAAAVAAVVAGTGGAVGVLLGTLVAAAFFAIGYIALTEVARRWPEALFGAAFLVYTTQIGMLLVLLLLLRDASFLNGRAFASGVLVGMAAWLTGQIRTTVRLKIPYVVPESSTVSPGGRP